MKIAESFNNHFTNIGKTTSQNVPNEITNYQYTNYLDKPIINSMFMEEIDYLYVMDLVKTLEPKISSGFDEVSSKLVKETISNIIHHLTHIINRSLNTAFSKILEQIISIWIAKNSYIKINKDSISNILRFIPFCTCLINALRIIILVMCQKLLMLLIMTFL